MIEFLIVIIINFVVFFLLFQLTLPRKDLVRNTVYEILDEILHFDPNFPESEWNSFILEKFDKIKYIETEEMISVLFEHKNAPRIIAFFALSFQTGKDRCEKLSRAKLKDFAYGSPEITEEDAAAIVAVSKLGVNDWIQFADSNSKKSFLTQLHCYLENLMDQDIRATLAPFYNTS
jgi:hypothetical protein